MRNGSACRRFLLQAWLLSLDERATITQFAVNMIINRKCDYGEESYLIRGSEISLVLEATNVYGLVVSRRAGQSF